MTQSADDDLDLLEEAVDVEQPKVVAGSIGSFVVLTAVAVGAGIAVIAALAFYGLPAFQAIAQVLSGG